MVRYLNPKRDALKPLPDIRGALQAEREARDEETTDRLYGGENLLRFDARTKEAYRKLGIIRDPYGSEASIQAKRARLDALRKSLEQ